jgi:putative hydrolase of the HAD superfamily
MRVLLFDVDGVLVHSRFHPDASKRRLWDEHLYDDLGVRPEHLQGLFGPDFMQVMTGKTSLVSALDAFLPAIGYRGSTMSFITYWMERDTHINYGLVDAILRLRRTSDVQVFLATNQEHIRAAFLWREFRLEHIFDDMLYAARLGAIKPEPEFFRAVDQRLGTQGQPPLLFDDSRSVVARAREHGWESVLFQRMEDFTGHPWMASRLV